MMKKGSVLFQGDGDTREWVVGIGSSALIHCLLLVIIIVFSGNGRYHSRMPEAIDVDLSYIPAPKTKPAASKHQTTKKPAVKKSTAKKNSNTVKQKVPVKSQKAVKKQKKKVVKPKDIINDAIKKLEKDLEKTKPDPIADRLRRLEEETARTKQLTGTASTEVKQDPVGSGKGEATVIDRYRYNIKVTVEEHWAFSENLAGGKKNLETRIIFNVYPNGEIRDIRFTRKSGNSYMDTAASMAIVKSNPVMPHPPGVNKPFIEVRLSFNPTGLD